MPTKYSHSVVLAHYSSLGLINLPNDQYISHLKTCASSKPGSATSRSKRHPENTYHSPSSSRGPSSRHRFVRDNVPNSTSITVPREYNQLRKHRVIEPDEESGDEHVIIHAKCRPFTPQPTSQKSNDIEGAEVQQKRRLSQSTYTGRSSSEASARPAPTYAMPHASTQASSEHKTSQSSIINLNDYAAPADQAGEVSAPSQNGSSSAAPPSRQPSNGSIRPKSQTEIVPRSWTPEARTDGSATDQTSLRDERLPERYLSQVTITPSNQGPSNGPRAGSSDRAVLGNPASFSQPRFSSSVVASGQPQRVDSLAHADRDAKPKQQGGPHRIRSFESISSVTSEDMMHLTTALPPWDSSRKPKSQNSLEPRKARAKFTPKDPKVTEESFDPSFFEALGDGPAANPAPSAAPQSTPLQSHPVEAPAGASAEDSQLSPEQPTANADFWRDLEELLSDSEASVVFPPDISKHKSRTGPTVAAGDKEDRERSWRNGSKDKNSKKSTTAPGPRTALLRDTTDAGAEDSSSPHPPLPRATRAHSPAATTTTTTSKNGANNSPSLSEDARVLTTVQLVDTSAPKWRQRGLLKKLRKKHDRREDPV